MGRNISTDLSRPKLEIIRTSEAWEVSPLLPEMITAGLCFRIQWILWRLSGIDLLAVVKYYTRSIRRSLSTEILFMHVKSHDLQNIPFTSKCC